MKLQVSLIKTPKMFSTYATSEKNKSATIIGYFKIVFEEKSVKSHDYRDVIDFKKLPF